MLHTTLNFEVPFAKFVSDKVKVFHYDGFKGITSSIKTSDNNTHVEKCGDDKYVDLIVNNVSTNHSEHMYYILKTFYHLLKNVSSLYIISTFKENKKNIDDISVKMSYLIKIYKEIYKIKDIKNPVYFFDVNSHSWYTLSVDEFNFQICHNVPKVHNNYAGVSSRNIPEDVVYRVLNGLYNIY